MNRIEEADVIRICGEDNDYIWMSEKAERRLSWILAGVAAVFTLPVFILPFLM